MIPAMPHIDYVLQENRLLITVCHDWRASHRFADLNEIAEVFQFQAAIPVPYLLILSVVPT
jgi:hypothetical protein